MPTMVPPPAGTPRGGDDPRRHQPAESAARAADSKSGISTPNLLSDPVCARRLAFAQWLVAHGRLNEGDLSPAKARHAPSTAPAPPASRAGETRPERPPSVGSAIQRGLQAVGRWLIQYLAEPSVRCPRCHTIVELVKAESNFEMILNVGFVASDAYRCPDCGVQFRRDRYLGNQLH